MGIRRVVVGVMVSVAMMLGAGWASAQVQTGSIAGSVSDPSGALLPGVSVTLTGERLIGGPQVQVTDATGSYRFDRLSPGSYAMRFELQGFRTLDRTEIIVNATFVATVPVKLEVGALSESITVTGESPTVDVKSNVQQTVMSQEILEGVPTGRDPWSLAKLIPGVQVATYDVGGTQSMQQSSMSAHGSNTNDVSYNIDGATVNWPGGGGGATMIYYDQGMFEEVNYITSAAPAEMLAGGVNINMVTKDGGNVWRGTARYNFANDSLQAENWADAQAIVPTFRGNPTKKTYDFNLNGGGAIIQNRMWVSGTIRKWVVNKLVNATNPDGSQALDDNDLKNYSGKLITQVTPNQKVSVGYFWNDKIRGHRRDSNDKIPDIASVVQTNPVQTTQVKYTGIRNRLVFESNFSVMDGQTNYTYQPDSDPTLPRIIDTVTTEVFNNSTREEHQPNSRHQFDNIFSFGKSGLGGEHLFKAGVQWGRLYYASDYSVRLDHWLVYNNNVPTAVRIYNSPAFSKNVATVTGFFFQDAWSMNRLTLNLGARWDKYVGTLPDQSSPGGTFAAGRTVAENEAINQSIAVWRLGRLVRSDRQRPHRDQVQLQPLRPAGGHRPRHQRQPADRRQRRLPVDRPQRQPQVRRWRDQPGDLPGVQRRHADQLRARRGLAVLGRGDGGRGNAAARPGPRRRDVLLPHQPQADRPAQHAGTPFRLHAAHGDGAERPRRNGAESEADDGDGVQPEPRARLRRAQRARQPGLPRHQISRHRVHRDEAFHQQMADAGGLHDRQERGRGERSGWAGGGQRSERPEQSRCIRTASSATTRRRHSACRAATCCRTRSTSPAR